MRDKNVSFELQSRVWKYLEFVMKKEINHEQEQDILNNLNISLKSEVILQTQGKLLIQNPFFIKNFSESTNQSLANKLKKITLSPEELVYKTGCYSNDCLYILEKGVLDERVTNLSGSSVNRIQVIFN